MLAGVGVGWGGLCEGAGQESPSAFGSHWALLTVHLDKKSTICAALMCDAEILCH